MAVSNRYTAYLLDHVTVLVGEAVESALKRYSEGLMDAEREANAKKKGSAQKKPNPGLRARKIRTFYQGLMAIGDEA